MSGRDEKSKEVLNNQHLNLRWYNSCLQAVKIILKYRDLDDDKKAELNLELGKVPLDEDHLRIYLKEKLTANQYLEVLKKTEDIIRKKEMDDEFKFQEALMVFNDDYFEMAEKFYQIQPFFYDKNKVWWLWNFKNFCWEMVDVVDLMNLIKANASPFLQITKSNVNSQVVKALEMVGRLKKPADLPKEYIQFRNKLYNIKTKEIIPAAPNYFACNPINWNIGQKTDTPFMDKLFNEWVGAEYLNSLYEIIAYCCYTDYPIHLCFCLIGSGRNGKSCFLRILNKFLSNKNICSTELDTLIDSRFESAKLYKKTACLLGETNFGILKKTSLLKKLVGQDLIGYELKGKNPFDDLNYAKIIICSNSLPSSEDNSDGFYRRWFIIDFNNEFEEGKDITETIPDEEYSNLALKVTERLPILLEKGSFTNQGTIEERKMRFILASNPLPLFIENCCIKDGNLFIPSSTLFSAYKQFLLKNKRRVVSRKEFNAILLQDGFEARRTFKDNIQDWYIEGLSLKKNYTDYTLYTILSHSTPYVRSQVENNGIKCIKCINLENEPIIFQKCARCSINDSIQFIEGKPICKSCLHLENIKDEKIE